jgi:hypothetical protein
MIKPSLEVFALADIKHFKVMAALNDGLNTDAGDTYAAAHRQFAELK